MTPSQADPAVVGPDDPARNQMGTTLVASLCLQVTRIVDPVEPIKSAVFEFSQSRTPWAATELANSLWAFDPGHPDVADLVATIDREAEACAGFTLPNKMRRAS